MAYGRLKVCNGLKEGLIVLVNRLIFRRVVHYRAALDYLEPALNSSDEQTLRRLIRLLIILCHKGLLKSRSVIIDASRRILKHSGARLSQQLLLYLWLMGSSADKELSMLALRNLSMNGNGIANYIVGGLGALDFESLWSVETYDFFVRSISAGFVGAMGSLGSHFIALGQRFSSAGLERAGFDLFIRAANRGDCASFFDLLWMSRGRHHDGLASTLLRFIQRARFLFSADRDSGAVRLLQHIYQGEFGFVQDLVLDVRLRRHPVVQPSLSYFPSLLLFGERLWPGQASPFGSVWYQIMLLNYRDRSEPFDLTLDDFRLL